MDEKQLAEAVAEKVMGWKKGNSEWADGCVRTGWRFAVPNFDMTPVFSPSIDARADYAVLRHVRDKWDDDRRIIFSQQLCWIFEERAASTPTVGIETDGYWYLVGDYARAALAALAREGVQG